MRASVQAGPMFTTLLSEALRLVRTCPCTGSVGCPACVQFAHCNGYNTMLHKKAAELVLHAVLEHELASMEADSETCALLTVGLSGQAEAAPACNNDAAPAPAEDCSGDRAAPGLVAAEGPCAGCGSLGDLGAGGSPVCASEENWSASRVEAAVKLLALQRPS